MKFTTTAEYNDYLLQKASKVNLENYFKAYHKFFCPESDISFMDYFLELCDHENEFYVPHDKLIEFGIISTTSNAWHVKRLLDKCEFENEVNYQLHKVVLLRNQGGTGERDLYMLKPETFKYLLMQAGTNSKQSINVKIYLNYYLLLEKVYKYYNEYDREYLNRLLSMKDEKIDNLLKDMNEQTKQMQDQSEKMNQLMIYTKDIKDELADIKILLKELLCIIRNITYLPNIFKQFYDKDHGNKKIKGNERFSLTSIGKTKALVFVGTLMESEHIFKVQCVNRKLNDSIVQVNKILDRERAYNQKQVFLMHDTLAELTDDSSDESDKEQPVTKTPQIISKIYVGEVKQQLEGKLHKVLMPQAYGISTINEQEVRSTFSNLTVKSPQFKDIAETCGIKKVRWDTKYKALMIEGISSVENAQLCFDTFIEANQIANMHAYDQSLEQSIIDSKEDVAVEVLDELKRRNNAFICKTKEDLDKFYQKTFAFDLRTPTLLRLKTKPFTTIDDLKTRVRELVVEGIDYE